LDFEHGYQDVKEVFELFRYMIVIQRVGQRSNDTYLPSQTFTIRLQALEQVTMQVRLTHFENELRVSITPLAILIIIVVLRSRLQSLKSGRMRKIVTSVTVMLYANVTRNAIRMKSVLLLLRVLKIPNSKRIV